MTSTKEKSNRDNDARIDAAFSRMGKDEQYLRTTADVLRDFMENDRETLEVTAQRYTITQPSAVLSS
jgi:hypothetical protein